MTAGKPQAGFCKGEAHNGAGSNTVTLSRPKGERNGEHKADLHTEGVLSTRPPRRRAGYMLAVQLGHRLAPRRQGALLHIPLQSPAGSKGNHGPQYRMYRDPS